MIQTTILAFLVTSSLVQLLVYHDLSASHNKAFLLYSCSLLVLKIGCCDVFCVESGSLWDKFIGVQ